MIRRYATADRLGGFPVRFGQPFPVLARLPPDAPAYIVCAFVARNLTATMFKSPLMHYSSERNQSFPGWHIRFNARLSFSSRP